MFADAGAPAVLTGFPLVVMLTDACAPAVLAPDFLAVIPAFLTTTLLASAVTSTLAISITPQQCTAVQTPCIERSKHACWSWTNLINQVRFPTPRIPHSLKINTKRLKTQARGRSQLTPFSKRKVHDLHNLTIQASELRDERQERTLSDNTHAHAHTYTSPFISDMIADTYCRKIRGDKASTSPTLKDLCSLAFILWQLI
jgi:hypothetical protein